MIGAGPSAGPRTRLVGLTGGIGCGKSTVLGMFEALGARTLDADQLAREAVSIGSEGLARVVDAFGTEVLTPKGALDRKRLGARIFADDAARATLNGIVHPIVRDLALQRIASMLEAGAPLVIYDVPLLYESGLAEMFPKVIVVHVPEAVQRARVRARDGLTDDEIEQRIQAQMPLADKVRRADLAIDNGGTLDETRARVEAVYAALTEGHDDEDDR